MTSPCGQILHTYIDTSDGHGYKFCLSVELDHSLRDHHIAFTGMTGQGARAVFCRVERGAVADSHQIVSVTTKYLDETTADPHDEDMEWVNSPAHLG